jgi:hypothetical protein
MQLSPFALVLLDRSSFIFEIFSVDCIVICVYIGLQFNTFAIRPVRDLLANIGFLD